MDDELDELIVAVRADTQAFAADMRTMRGTFDTTLVDSFEQAGRVLERGLLAAIRKGSLGFEDLQRMANAALDQIAAQALQLGLENLFAAPAGSGIGHALGGAVGALFGLSGGRARPGGLRPHERGPGRARIRTGRAPLRRPRGHHAGDAAGHRWPRRAAALVAASRQRGAPRPRPVTLPQ